MTFLDCVSGSLLQSVYSPRETASLIVPQLRALQPEDWGCPSFRTLPAARIW